ncbi:MULTISPECIES: hypothetical protein [unclassified Streptomyces]|uniref:hypothetical protein n=1 Tax=Streptomyces sp. NPDC127129 TaxID=3345373 RepID=UPI00363E9572
MIDESPGWLSPTALGPPPATPARRLRTRALWAGLLLVPGTVLSGFLALTTENASSCVTHGHHCGSTPGWLYLATFVIIAVAWIHALTTPDAPAEPATSRKAALWTLIGVESVFLLLVATSFA